MLSQLSQHFTAEELVACHCVFCGKLPVIWKRPPGETVCPRCCHWSLHGHQFIPDRDEQMRCTRCGILMADATGHFAGVR